ncbi:hypothetical protein ACMD2_15067 [Ananas comosus]|uniref:Hyaluronan/mRNA-binding protein domain-containing protein n=1 Tax=Ananas comosus TaxID=4615 RepID=A0A199W2Q2_ANACO|nr:hypothetical protein ACMD2_15067 [Ananas comosus]
MATKNPFDLLGDDESDDPTQLIAAQEQKSAAKKPSAAAPPAAAAKLPSKPVPPAQAVREARSNTAPTRGGPGRGGPGRGRGGRGAVAGQSRDFGNGNGGGYSGGGGGGGGGGGVYSGVGGEDGDVSRPTERGRGPRQPYRGGRRGGYGNEGEAADELGRPPRRLYDRKSGTGRGYGMKREGAGRGNWGIVTDEPIAQLRPFPFILLFWKAVCKELEADETVNIEEKSAVAEKKAEEDAPSVEDKDNKEGASKEAEEKEQEDKEMTLDEYEKVKEEKRKALLALKAEERKVEIDKELQSMQQLSLKKGNDEVFIMLVSSLSQFSLSFLTVLMVSKGSEKEALKKKENAERDERAKKSLSINEFLKPAEGERYYSAGGRGRGRGRGPFRGGFGGGSTRGPTAAPSIEDQEQFPTLSGK